MSKKIRALVRSSGCNPRKVISGVALYKNIDTDFENFARIVVEKCLERTLPYVDESLRKGIVDDVNSFFEFINDKR